MKAQPVGMGNSKNDESILLTVQRLPRDLIQEPPQFSLRLDESGGVSQRITLGSKDLRDRLTFAFTRDEKHDAVGMVDQRCCEGNPRLSVSVPDGNEALLYMQSIGMGEEGGCMGIVPQSQQN